MHKLYDVPLPWKSQNKYPSYNKAVAKKRVTSLTKKLMKVEAIPVKYD